MKNNKKKYVLCRNIRQLNDANTMSLGIAVSVDSVKILRSFAATCRCDTVLESRKFCGLGYPEKMVNRPILSFREQL